MESSHIVPLKVPVLSKQDRRNHFPPKMKTPPLISLGVSCDDRFTITQDKQDILVQKIGREIIKGTINKQIGMWEIPMETKLSEAVSNNCNRVSSN